MPPRFAASQIDRLLRNVTARVRRTLRSPDADSVHDLRVSIRRFDQALLMFAQLLPAKPIKKARRRLKEIMRCAGEVRNCDIAEKLLAESFPDIQVRIRTQRKDAQKSLVAALGAWENDGDLKPDGRSLKPDPFRTIRRMMKDFFRFGGQAAKHASPTALHCFRIAAKHYRYSLELFAPILGRRLTAAHLTAIKAVQSRLGNVNDCETVRVMAADWKVSGKIDRFLKKRERGQMRMFRKEWRRRFGEADQRRHWLASFAADPRHSSE